MRSGLASPDSAAALIGAAGFGAVGAVMETALADEVAQVGEVLQ